MQVFTCKKFTYDDALAKWPTLYEKVKKEKKIRICWGLNPWPLLCHMRILPLCHMVPRPGVQSPTGPDFYIILESVKFLKLKVIFSDSNNIFLWHKSEDIDKKCLLPKFQLIPISHLQVMHYYVHWHCSRDYCVKNSLVDETLCKKINFSLIPLGNCVI